MVPIGTVTYSASNSKELLLSGLDAQQEVRTLRILLVCTLISTGAAFAWALADYATLANKICSRIRISMDQDENAESLTPVEWRTDAIDATGNDPFQEFLTVGDSIPISSGSAITVKLPIDVNYIHEGLECPNLFAPSSDQINAGAAKVAIDWLAAPGNVVYTNGTATTVVSDAKVQADLGDAHMIYCAPHWSRKVKGATAQYDLEETPGVELLLAQESVPATFETSVSQLSVNVDERFKPRNMPPTELAAAYGRSGVRRRPDRVTAIDITNNTLGGGTGAIVSPIRWVNARIRQAEYELPFYLRKRKVEFPSGVSFAYSFLRKVTGHISRQEEIIKTLMGAARVGGSPQDLATRGFGGADNDTMRGFKGRVVKYTNT